MSGYCFLTHHAGILLSYTPCRGTAFLHIMPGYCFLTHHAGILLSYTPCRDTAISSRVGYLSPTPYCACANVILPYRITFYCKTTTKIIDGTMRFNNAKIQTHALGSICVRCDGGIE